MSEANRTELQAVSKQSGDKRYQYFLEQVVQNGHIWSLDSEEGWVVLSTDDDEECLPIWSHQELAASWATDDWSDCSPQAIALDLWLSRWTPGMIEDDSLLAVFPVEDGEGTVVSPQELKAALEAEMKKQGKA